MRFVKHDSLEFADLGVISAPNSSTSNKSPLCDSQDLADMIRAFRQHFGYLRPWSCQRLAIRFEMLNIHTKNAKHSHLNTQLPSLTLGSLLKPKQPLAIVDSEILFVPFDDAFFG